MGVNYTIPDHLLDQLYVATNSSPNSDVFTQNKLQRLPIPVLGLDNITSWVSDCLQDAQNQINRIQIEGIGVQGNQNQFLYFSADNVLGAINLQDMLNALGALVFNGSNISAGTIYGTSLRKNTLKKDNYGLQSIETEAIKDLSVTNAKIANGTVQLPKMRSSGHSCFVIGDDANYAYKELPVAANYYVPTRIANATLPSMQPISVVWNSSVNASCSISKLMTEATGGFLISGAGNASIEILPVLDTDYWKLAVRTSASSGKVTLKTLAEIAVNSPFTDNTINGSKLVDNTVDGSKVTDGSLPKTKLQNAGQLVTFAVGYTGTSNYVNASVQRVNVGEYKITFTTPAPNAGYAAFAIPQITTVSGTVVGNTRTNNSFNFIFVDSHNTRYDTAFSFVVYAF